MAQVTAKMVKELRDMTGVGMMDAKKALVAVDGDMDQAVDYLRENGMAKAAKKADRIAAEGLANVYVSGNTAVVVEINAETDFVAKNDQFQKLVQDVTTLIADNKPANVEEALNLSTEEGTLSDTIATATSVIGEKISQRFQNDVEKFFLRF